MTKKLAGLIIVMMVSSSCLWAQDRAKIEKWSVEADTLMNRQDFNGALTLLNNVIAESKLKTEEDWLALYNRALCYFSLQRYEEALKDVNQYLAKFPELHAQYLRLYIYMEKGDAASLTKELDKLIQEQPENPQFLTWRFSVSMEEGKYAKARKDIYALMAMEKTPELVYSLGLSYYQEGNPDSALLAFEDLIKINPDTPEGYLYAGSICIEEEAYELSLKYLNSGLQKFPTDNVLMFYKGVALVELEKTKEGCRCLTKAFNNGFDDAVDYLKQYCYGIEE